MSALCTRPPWMRITGPPVINSREALAQPRAELGGAGATWWRV